MTYIFILALVALFGVFFSYRQGLKDGKRIENNEELKPILKPPKKAVKESDEERRAKILFDNVNNYDGTAKGQKEVK
jgi:hypothetical protein